ncbi:hypothetical protein ACF0H5_002835 [Mactra antiquata]
MAEEDVIDSVKTFDQSLVLKPKQIECFRHILSGRIWRKYNVSIIAWNYEEERTKEEYCFSGVNAPDVPKQSGGKVVVVVTLT